MVESRRGFDIPLFRFVNTRITGVESLLGRSAVFISILMKTILCVHAAEPIPLVRESRLCVPGFASAVKRERVAILYVRRDSDLGEVAPGRDAEFAEITPKE